MQEVGGDPTVSQQVRAMAQGLEKGGGAAGAQQTQQSTPPATSSTPQPLGSQPLVKKSTRGAVFYKNFQPQIDNHITAKFEEFAESIMMQLTKNTSSTLSRVLLSLLDRHSRAKQQPHSLTTRRTFLSHLLPRLENLAPWVKDDSTVQQKQSTLELLQKILMLDAPYLLTSTGLAPSVRFICEVVVSFLNKSSPLGFKNHVLDLLPYLLTSSLPAEFKKLVRISCISVNLIFIFGRYTIGSMTW